MRHPPFKTVMLLQKGPTLASATKKARRKAQKKVVNPRLINAKQLLTEPNQQSWISLENSSSQKKLFLIPATK